MTTTTRRKINVPRLIQLAEWAGAQDARRSLGLVSEWDQSHWLLKVDELRTIEVSPCGTACCIAGKVALEDGWMPESAVLQPGDWIDGISEDYVVQVIQTGPRKGHAKGDPRLVPDVAAEILGLAPDQADRLFDGNNDLERVLEVIGELLEDAADDARQAARR